MTASILSNLTKLSPLEKPTMKGGEILPRMLAAEGVDTVFGMIDGTYFGPIRTLEANGIGLVTPRHEASARHMAGAYARTAGKLGVAIASRGPGVANAIAGVAVEHAEGNRVLLITSSRRVGISHRTAAGPTSTFITSTSWLRWRTGRPGCRAWTAWPSSCAPPWAWSTLGAPGSCTSTCPRAS